MKLLGRRQLTSDLVKAFVPRASKKLSIKVAQDGPDCWTVFCDGEAHAWGNETAMKDLAYWLPSSRAYQKRRTRKYRGHSLLWKLP